MTPNGASATPNPSYGTPPEVVQVARTLMGGIDLDPATTANANRWIGATRIIEPPADGLVMTWPGRVFLNPPGGLGGQAKRWWKHLLSEYVAGRTTQAFFCAFSIDALQWSQCEGEGLLTWPTFIPDHRIAYLDHESGARTVSPPKPSAFTWITDNPDPVALRGAFASVGIRGVVVHSA